MMRFRVTASGTCIAVFLFSPFFASAEVSPDCTLFTRNLKIGMSGSDVKALQIFLNSNPNTIVSPDGAGSIGNETDYFGSRTKQAVIAFQEMYASEVLTPVDLVKGSGFVGSYSRAKISALCTSPTAPNSQTTNIPVLSGKAALYQTGTKYPTASKTTSIPEVVSTGSKTITPQSNISATPALAQGIVSSYFDDSKPFIMNIGETVPQGGELMIQGGGFTPTNNTVTIGGVRYPGISSSLSGVLKVSIPKTSPTGKMKVVVTNSKGESNESFAVVTNMGVSAPVIRSVSPQTGAVVGTVVTLTGENFTPTGNAVSFGSSMISASVSSDGKKLTFTTKPPLEYDHEDLEPGDLMTDDIWFYVINANGVSEPVKINITF